MLPLCAMPVSVARQCSFLRLVHILSFTMICIPAISSGGNPVSLQGATKNSKF